MEGFDNIWNKTIRTVFLSFYSQFILNNLYSSKLLDLLLLLDLVNKWISHLIEIFF